MKTAVAKTQPRDKGPRSLASGLSSAYRVTDYPLHYFAAIQWQNQVNLGRVLRKVGLTVPMWRALAALQQQDGQTIGEIAQLAVVDRSSLGRLLDAAAKDGLVDREPLQDDRRAVAIRLSQRGRKLFEQALPLVRQHHKRLLKGLSKDEIETLMRLVRRIKANSRLMADVNDVELPDLHETF